MSAEQKPNPAKAAKEKRIKMMNMFVKMHPSEKKAWNVSEIADVTGDKLTLQELNNALILKGFKARIIISPLSSV